MNLFSFETTTRTYFVLNQTTLLWYLHEILSFGFEMIGNMFGISLKRGEKESERNLIAFFAWIRHDPNLRQQFRT